MPTCCRQRSAIALHPGGRAAEAQSLRPTHMPNRAWPKVRRAEYTQQCQPTMTWRGMALILDQNEGAVSTMKFDICNIEEARMLHESWKNDVSHTLQRFVGAILGIATAGCWSHVEKPSG